MAETGRMAHGMLQEKTVLMDQVEKFGLQQSISISNRHFRLRLSKNTVFGQYSSANGQVYEFGYTDIASGDSFARTGVKSPIAGSGDGRRWRKRWREGQ